MSERVQGRSRDGSADEDPAGGSSRAESGRASLRKGSGGPSRPGSSGPGSSGRSPKATRAAAPESTESDRGPAKAQSPRAVRRAALREAAAERKAAEQRRRRFALAGVAVLLVLGLVVGFLVWRSSRNHETTASSAPSSTAPAFIGPPVPAAANPALSAKPSAGPGTGDLTKLQATTLVAGTGPEVKSGQTVQVNYVGVSYKTGAEFDSNWGKGQPFSFKVGGGQVIKGWDQGLVGVKVGSRVQLDIPADLAYGDDASGGKPAGPLRFIIDVLEAE